MQNPVSLFTQIRCNTCKNPFSKKNELFKIFVYNLNSKPTLHFTKTTTGGLSFSIIHKVQPAITYIHNYCLPLLQKEFYTSFQDKFLTIFNKTQRNLKNVSVFTYNNELFSTINFTVIKLDYNVKELDFNDTSTMRYFLYSLICNNNIDLCNTFVNAIQNQVFKNTVLQNLQVMSKQKFSHLRNNSQLIPHIKIIVPAII